MSDAPKENPVSFFRFPGSRHVRAKHIRSHSYYKILGYLFLFPCLFLVGIFTIYPALASLFHSFHLISPFGERMIFYGFGHYKDLLTSESYMNSLKVTLTFVLGTVPFGLVISLILAMLLNAKIRAMFLYRTIFFLPIAISPAMAGVIWLFFYNSSTGILNYYLSLLQINGPAWLTDPSWALIAVIVVTVWKQMGFNVIIYLAGLQNIPDEIYEAGEIDGAGGFSRFRYITLPMLSPTIFFLLITSVISSFEVFGQVHVMTHGGPAEATNLLVYQLYRDAFVNFNTGAACAQAYIIFLIILLITFIQFKVLGRKVHYQ